MVKLKIRMFVATKIISTQFKHQALYLELNECVESKTLQGDYMFLPNHCFVRYFSIKLMRTSFLENGSKESI